MLPKNNRNIYPEKNINCQTNGNQTFRPPNSVSGNPFMSNPNLVVTQQQQPTRINNSYQLNSASSTNANNLNQIEVVKRIAAAMQQPQSHPMHLLNRQSQPSIPIVPTPLQVNQNSQILLDRAQMIRIPTSSQENSAASTLCQALYFIQQNLIFQNDKAKQTSNHVSDICKQTVSNQSLPLNHSTNSLSAITISSSPIASQSQNATVLAMSNVDVQILEAFNRLNSQQNAKPISSTPINSNLSLIQPDTNMTQQLINALQKQGSRTTSGSNSQGFMLIGQTAKSTQSNLNNNNNNNVKSTVSFSPVSSNMNINVNNDSQMLKAPLNSKVTEIPMLTKLLDKLSYNSENFSDFNRQFKLRELEESQSQRNVNNKVLSSQNRQVSENSKYPNNDSVQRSIELLIANNSSKLNSQIIKSHNNIDTHQILRDSKEISYLMPNSASNVIINNDDMINQHFNQSLRNKLDIKKNFSTEMDNTFSYKNSVSTHHNSDESLSKTINDIISNKKFSKNKISCSFIDLQRPESLLDHHISSENSSSNSNVSAINVKPVLSNYMNPNNKLSIKETAGKMVENLLKRSLNTCPVTKQQSNKQVNIPNSASQSKEYSESCAVNNNNKVAISSVASNADGGKSSISNVNDGQNAANSTTVNHLEFNCYKDKIGTKNRINPSKHDLPLKKRIMLDFNENCSDQNTENDVSDGNGKVEPKFEMKPDNVKAEAMDQSNDKQNKIRRKRMHSDSMNDSLSINDPNLPTIKKRRGRIPGTGKKQKMKEECRLKEIAKMNLAGTEESWHELALAINKPPDIDKISAKTLCVLDLEPFKMSKAPFFQIGSCNEIAPRMVKCRSCRQNNFQNNNNDQSINTADDASSNKSESRDSSSNTVVSSFCRFHGFRKLQFSSKGTLTQAGFCKSYEADSQDLSLWRMFYPLNCDLSISTASYIIESLSEIFCQIIENENQFVKDCYESMEDPELKLINKKKQIVLNGSKYCNKSEFNGLVWKRPVQGVREMCDVCDTSIFNTHWGCRKCGYSVCVDCFNERNEKSSVPEMKKERFVVEPLLQKSNNNLSASSQFMKIKSNAAAVHQNTRGASRNRQFTSDRAWAVCTANRQPHIPDQLLKVELIPIKVLNELRNRMHTVAKLFNLKLRCNCLMKSKPEHSPKLSEQISESLPIIESNSMSCENDLHLLADLALKEVVNGEHSKSSIETELNEKLKSHCSTLRPPPVLSPPHHPENVQYANSQNSDLALLKLSDTDTAYSWIYVSPDFKIVRLHNAQNPENLKIFQQELLSAHPVIVSGCHKSMDLRLWTPEKFLEEFELEPATLVDCETGYPVPKGTMKAFWEGFECIGKRISSTDSSSSKPACLKLKDWPPSDDFNDVLPQRCKDILNNLPLKPYTGRQGELNLAGHLLEFFVRPDLGPKLYNAYGMPRESKLGTTNLHLDIADAVNVMLYVGIPKDMMASEINNVLLSMKEAMVDDSVLKRAESEIPGALWHIFLPKDVPKLRQFLYDVIIEQGDIIDSNRDPIHDQQFYLDQSMLNRLKLEYNVNGCAIVQFRGDAIFIPAGSPHQVRNLHSCMKVANDFVSPENILRCLQVTKEFRKLSPVHTNHEDKLQAKNMIFHAMKDAVATLIMKNNQYGTANASSAASSGKEMFSKQQYHFGSLLSTSSSYRKRKSSPIVMAVHEEDNERKKSSSSSSSSISCRTVSGSLPITTTSTVIVTTATGAISQKQQLSQYKCQSNNIISSLVANNNNNNSNHSNNDLIDPPHAMFDSSNINNGNNNNNYNNNNYNNNNHNNNNHNNNNHNNNNNNNNGN